MRGTRFTAGDPNRRSTAVRWLVLGCCAVLAALGQHSAPLRVRAQAEATVHYRAGWNIVAVPTGTTLSKTAGPAYAFGPDSDGYQALGPGELVGGRAAWVYFTDDTDVTLGRSAAEYSRVLAPADQYLLAGNPTSGDAVSVSGADVVAFAYDPQSGYNQVSRLAPGRGAFLISHPGGAITLGKAPAGADTAEATRLQGALTANPADRASLDQLTAVAGDLVKNRQYAQVQSVLDDLRAADDDGFRKQGSAPAPTLSKAQIDAEVAVREDLARAKDAAAAGDLARADADMDAARKAAQDALDDGQTLAHSNSQPDFLFATATPAGLAQARALLRAGLPFAATAQKLPDGFFQTVNAQVNGTPLPPLAAATRFFGTVTVNGQTASGSAVTAMIGGVTCGSAPISASGAYALDLQAIAGCITPGATVTFSVGGVMASPAGTLPAMRGAQVQLDLSIVTQSSTVSRTPAPAGGQANDVAVPFNTCNNGQFALQFLSEARTSVGIINDTFQYAASGLAPGSYAIWAALTSLPTQASTQPDGFAQSARQVAAGTVGSGGAVSGTLTLVSTITAFAQNARYANAANTTPSPTPVTQPNPQPVTTIGLELVSNGRCWQAITFVPQQATTSQAGP